MRPRYLAAAALDRATGLKPVARTRERIRARGHAEPGVGPDGLPMPSAWLRGLVGSPDADRWLLEGRLNAQAITHAVELRGRVLDFGCGCGRSARNFAGLPIDLHGCDVNAEAVRWCEQNLPHMAATVNAAEPPAPYPDATFDVIYAISILTHLTVARGAAWIEDWRRMLKPGGTLLVTVHGDAYRDELRGA